MAESFPGGRRLILQALRRGNVPEECLEVCIASITENSICQYSSGLKLWWEFCKQKGLNVFSAGVEDILKFLVLQFDRGSSYSSLNSYRSAIAQISNTDMGQDFRLKRFFKGVYNLRPSLPKYSETWDPIIVLNSVKNISNSTCSFEELSSKLAVLILLATGQRVQTLSLIECVNIVKTSSEIRIKIPRRIKTSARNRLQPILCLPFFNENENICVARTLMSYLERTESRRGTIQELFITTTKPFKKASTQTICRWVKNALNKAGLDTNRFSAHSTRHAATSAAARKGINIDTIRQHAGWTDRSKTFASVYNRPLISKDNFAEAVFETR